MTLTLHKLCIRSVLVMFPMLLVGMALAGLFPPPSPARSDLMVAHFLADHQLRVQLGLILAMTGSVLLIPFMAALAEEVRHMVSGARMLAASIQAISAGIVIAFFELAFVLMMAAAYKPERSPDVVGALYDLGWFILLVPVSQTVLQFVALGRAILLDSRPVPTFPRWFGYATLFAALDMFGGSFCALAKVGPLAWNGLVPYWLPFAAFGMWVVAAPVFLCRAADRRWAAAP